MFVFAIENNGEHNTSDENGYGNDLSLTQFDRAYDMIIAVDTNFFDEKSLESIQD
jgi:hypothetical protein